VGVPVVIVPGLLMLVDSIVRRDLVEGRLQVMVHQAGLELSCGDAGGRSDDEDSRDAACDLAVA